MEILIVVAIIAVLVAVAIPIATAQLERTREAADLANARSAYMQVSTDALLGNATSSVTVKLKQKQSDWQSADPVNIGGIVIDDFKVVNGKNGIFLGEPSKPDPTTRTGYRSTARVTNRALQERLSAAAADGYNMAVEKLIARAEALRPKPIREQMANAAKEAAKENAARPAPAKGKEARDDR